MPHQPQLQSLSSSPCQDSGLLGTSSPALLAALEMMHCPKRERWEVCDKKIRKKIKKRGKQKKKVEHFYYTRNTRVTNDFLKINHKNKQKSFSAVSKAKSIASDASNERHSAIFISGSLHTPNGVGCNTIPVTAHQHWEGNTKCHWHCQCHCVPVCALGSTCTVEGAGFLLDR